MSKDLENLKFLAKRLTLVNKHSAAMLRATGHILKGMRPNKNGNYDITHLLTIQDKIINGLNILINAPEPVVNDFIEVELKGGLK